uniref:Zinc transport protein ZntB n=1 Tax=Triticum urartu TaxID=4572 RepID=A0A8R7PT78_TRIUA
MDGEPRWHNSFPSNVRKELIHSLGSSTKEASPQSDLWTGGLVCAFEFVRGHGFASPPNLSRNNSSQYSKDHSAAMDPTKLPITKLGDVSSQGSEDGEEPGPACKHGKASPESYWVPIGWRRIAELVEMVEGDAAWDGQGMGGLMDDGDQCCDITVADVAAPYWQRPAGPTWWCHVTAGHPAVDAWLAGARWLHPAIRVALRDESMLISEKMKHLLYEVPVRVAGGLLFELLGQSVGDPAGDEDDIPIVLRAWQAQNFLITALHVKGSATNINVIGVTEVQELLSACGSTAPKSIHEVVAHLASRLARWDDRLWRKYVFGAADEIEVKFVNRRNQEDLNLLCIIFNQDIRRLATQVIRVKWSLHAREEIIFELLQYLRGTATRFLLEGIRKDTRQMIEEQEAVRGRLFTIQDVMQSTVRAWLQDKSLRITHNLTIFGGCGLILSIITGLFGINVDGIPGAKNTPYAFALFSGLLFLLGFMLIIVGIIYFGLQKPVSDEQVQMRKLELQQLVSMFQHEAETHAKVREGVLRSDLPPRAADLIYDKGDACFLISPASKFATLLLIYFCFPCIHQRVNLEGIFRLKQSVSQRFRVTTW